MAQKRKPKKPVQQKLKWYSEGSHAAVMRGGVAAAAAAFGGRAPKQAKKAIQRRVGDAFNAQLSLYKKDPSRFR